MPKRKVLNPDKAKSKLNSIFDNFTEEKGDDLIDGECLEKLVRAVNLDPETQEAFVLPWQLNCQEFMVITRKEFVDGLAEHNIQTMDRIKAFIRDANASLKHLRNFKKFYIFLFKYMIEKRRKSVNIEMALQMWGLVLRAHWTLIDDWLEFMTEKSTPKTEDGKAELIAVSKDLWIQVFEFIQEVESDISTKYDPDGAWPVLIDDFVEYLKKKQK